MTIPMSLVVAQWGLLLVLGVLVLIMYRQFAYQFGAYGGPQASGLAPGSEAPRFEYRRADGVGGMVRLVPGDGRRRLLVFADPSCATCEEAVDRLKSVLDHAGGDVVEVVVVTADPPAFIDISPAFSCLGTPIGLIEREVQGLYRVRATPQFFTIDERGDITDSGVAWSTDQIARALHEDDHDISSGGRS